MLKFYFKNHPEHKSTMKEVKNRIKEIEAEENAETVEESDEKVSTKKNSKKANKAESQNGSAEPEKLLKKKTERKQSEAEKEETTKKDVKKAKKQEKEKAEAEDEEEEYDFKFKKPIVNEPRSKIPNAPFKRVSEEIVEQLDDHFKDNSYETFMMKSGNTYGKEANDKLKVVRGKDFKKEKTKFKNKSAAGSFSISTEIKSIKLDLDSD